MKTITGTNHFSSFEAARQYYSNYGFSADDVRRKIQNGEINYGKPDEKDGREIFLNEKEGRYFISGE